MGKKGPSPKPWRAVMRDSILWDANLRPIATIYYPYDGDHIVKCVNAHDALSESSAKLRAALEEIAGDCDDYTKQGRFPTEGQYRCALQAFAKIARAALAEAKGEEGA